MSEPELQFAASSDSAGEFAELVAQHLAGELSDIQRKQLNAQLAVRPERCRQFVAMCFQAHLFATCVDPEFTTEDYLADYSDDEGFFSDQTPTSPSPSIFGGLAAGTFHGTAGYFSSGWPAAYLIATVVVGVGLWISSVTPAFYPQQIAKPSIPLPSPLSPLPLMVGRVTATADCQWARNVVPLLVNDAVPAGQAIRLESGLMEIAYGTGAKVILQGPVTYEVESPAGGFLSVGKLTARVENTKTQDLRPKTQDPNPKSPNRQIANFVVRTSTAIVTDLGTEFGVEVAKSGETTSHVFRGSVRVQRITTDGTAETDGRVLGENETVRVEGLPGSRQIVALHTFTPSHFVRDIPKHRIKVLDLVDVVAGGDGFSGRRNRGIDPTNGRVADRPPTGPFLPKSDGQYHRVDGSTLVDGVFIPGSGAGAVRVDSVGHTFDGFSVGESRTSGYVWAGGAVSGGKSPIPTILGGIDYASSGHGLIFLHANKGVTFDLEAIRRANPGCKLLRFRAKAGNTETDSANAVGVRMSADLWVLVDGSVRYQRRDINGCSGAFPILIRLAEEDRFLTLAATDGGNDIRWDWTMFGDPQLILVTDVSEQHKPTAATRAAEGR